MITQRENTFTDLMDIRRRILIAISLSLTGQRLTCVTYLDTHQKENFYVHKKRTRNENRIFSNIYGIACIYNTYGERKRN